MSQTFNLIGKVKVIEAEQQISDSFKKRNIVLAIDEDTDYPQYLSFELTQRNCAKADFWSIGDLVDVSFNLRGRAWKNKEGVTKYFNSLQAYDLSEIAKKGEPKLEAETNDDLPF